jgi:hypothetical protein
MTNHFPDATKKVLSPAAQAVLDAYSKYVSEWFKSIKTDKSSSHYHASGLAAALRAAADHVEWPADVSLRIIASELEVHG